MKDLDRTFPTHPFFNKEGYGDIGQKALMNILKSFSVFNEKVGYCQSMNFIVGFIMLMSGSNEQETFWFFAALLETSRHVGNPSEVHPIDAAKFDGLKGFYKKNFPILQLYFYQFESIFAEMLPNLYNHF